MSDFITGMFGGGAGQSKQDAKSVRTNKTTGTTTTSEHTSRTAAPIAYAKAFIKTVLSHFGLAICVFIYVVGGAWLFREIESKKEVDQLKGAIKKRDDLSKYRQELADELWKQKYAGKYAKPTEHILEEYEAKVAQHIKDTAICGKSAALDTEKNGTSTDLWSFSSALLFTVSVVTTIGYGHVAPKTEMGRLTLIAYALVGMPLMLMFLANIGDAMARFFRIAYEILPCRIKLIIARGCCFVCNRRRIKEYAIGQAEYMEKLRERELRSAKEPKSAWDEDDEGVRYRKGKRVDIEADDRDAVLDRKVVFIPPESLEPPDDQISVPVSLSLVVVASYIMIGAVLFASWNQWSWLSGAYFSFVTLSTIGFGDLVPGWDEVGTTAANIKLGLSSFYIVMGLAVLSMSFNLMMEEMIEKLKFIGKLIGFISEEEESDATTLGTFGAASGTENVDTSDFTQLVN